jgi:hypothetical protein
MGRVREDDAVFAIQRKLEPRKLSGLLQKSDHEHEHECVRARGDSPARESDARISIALVEIYNVKLEQISLDAPLTFLVTTPSITSSGVSSNLQTG